MTDAKGHFDMQIFGGSNLSNMGAGPAIGLGL
jgi:hypothetical protein